MTDHSYATFDQYGRCLNIVRSAIELDLPYAVDRNTNPNDIYLDDNGEISIRKDIEISIDRDYFINDGTDCPVIKKSVDDHIKLLVNNVIGANLTSLHSGPMMIEVVGEYRAEPLCVMFTTLDDLAVRFAEMVDQAAGEARARHMTTIPGQQIIYAKKEAEALAWVNQEPGEYPFLTAEAGEGSVDDLAQTILARARATEAALASIEALRMGAKQAISNATDAAAILAASNVTWP